VGSKDERCQISNHSLDRGFQTDYTAYLICLRKENRLNTAIKSSCAISCINLEKSNILDTDKATSFPDDGDTTSKTLDFCSKLKQ
jgi:hypothetical protein